MITTFEQFWDELESALREIVPIRNWTVDSGFVGQDFNAKASGETIHCAPPGADVSKDDFEVIWQVWEDYLSGDLKRKELRDLPHYNTKYVISILHHFMENTE